MYAQECFILLLLQAQQDSPEAIAARQRAEAEAAAADSVAAVHEDNEWSIEVVPDEPAPQAAAAGGHGSAAQGHSAVLPEGLSFSHVRPCQAVPLHCSGIEWRTVARGGHSCKQKHRLLEWKRMCGAPGYCVAESVSVLTEHAPHVHPPSSV